MKAKVISAFSLYEPGDIYEGTPERINYLIRMKKAEPIKEKAEKKDEKEKKEVKPQKKKED